MRELLPVERRALAILRAETGRPAVGLYKAAYTSDTYVSMRVDRFTNEEAVEALEAGQLHYQYFYGGLRWWIVTSFSEASAARRRYG